MYPVILDCDLMRFPYSGLYYYCLSLGNAINEELKAQGKGDMLMYLPPKKKLSLQQQPFHMRQQKWHPYWQPFMRSCKVWHEPFQSGRMMPNKQKYPDLKVLLTIHDLNALHEGKTAEQQEKSIAHTQRLIDQADSIICISNFVKQDVEQHCQLQGKPIDVIYNGLVEPAAIQVELHTYQPVRPFLFGMGYVNGKKNFLTLLPILEANPDLELVIAGRLDDPSYVQQIEQQAATLGVADRVKLTGPITEGEKAYYLQNCLAFMHPSLAEGFGVPVVEAMAYGKPVFMSRRTSLPEVGGSLGFYFDDFSPQHMQEVFGQGLERINQEDLSEARKQHAASFNWATAAKKYIQHYEDLF